MTPRGERVKDADLIAGALPLMGKAYWIARAAEPGADRVGPTFVLSLPPRREGSEIPAHAVVTAAHTKPRGRSRAA